MFVDAKKEGFGITRCRGKRDMASFRSWTHLVGSTPKAVWFVLAAILLGTSLRTCQGPCREQQQLCSLHKNFHRPTVPQYPSNIFYSYFRFSCLTTFRRRWNHLVLESSCLRRARLSPFVVCLPPESRRNQLESLGYLPLSFVLSLEMCFKFFLGRHFGDPNKNFWILWAVQWNATRLQCSQWPSNGIFESKSFYFKETFSASFVILFKCCKFREQWNLTPVHIWASTL